MGALGLTACGGVADSEETAPVDAEELSFQIGAIPEEYQGGWDFETGPCTRASDMFVEIGPGQLVFYESVGNLTFIAEEGDDVVLMLAMEGEGETWTQSLRLSLMGEGADQRLYTSDGSQPKMVDQYPLRKCP